MPEITINLNDNIMNLVKRRAKKTLLSPKQLVEDIVRRSMLSYKDYGKLSPAINTDDKLLNIFSRARRSRKNKK